MSEQTENLDRVTARIGAAILEFYRLKVEAGKREFYVEELRRYVRDEVGIIAPASPDRVMRALRQDGLLNYSVQNRSESLYRIEERRPEAVRPWFFNGADQGELFPGKISDNGH